MGKLKVIKASTLVTIQDQGRIGYRQYGIPQSGAMDLHALYQANLLVGNPKEFAGLEMSLQGIKLEVLEPTIVAVTGARTIIKINGKTVEMDQTHELTPGDKFSVSAPMEGVYSYMGIGGKLIGQYDFGSLSTYLLAGFGGLNGREIRSGDVLLTENDPVFSEKKEPVKGFNPNKEAVIRFIESPESSLVKELDALTYQIGNESNRVGIQLKGEPLDSSTKEIISSAVVPGTIQLLPSGLPIVLMNDCQTTGGYPRIGKVIDADLGRLAQLSAGMVFTFCKISLEEARILTE